MEGEREREGEGEGEGEREGEGEGEGEGGREGGKDRGREGGREGGGERDGESKGGRDIVRQSKGRKCIEIIAVSQEYVQRTIPIFLFLICRNFLFTIYIELITHQIRTTVPVDGIPLQKML